MAMGVKNAAPTFQRMMNNVLLGLQGIMCFVYIDDLVIYGKNLNDHNNKLKSILERLQQYKLKVNPQKCDFLQKEINFHGHVISRTGVKPDPKKIDAISRFPIPKTFKEIKSFLGLASYYRKFIDNFAQTVHPINKLLRKNVQYNWSTECNDAFLLIKEKLTTAPILIHPDFSKPFIVRTDASQYAIGAILSQGKLREDLPIAYMSKALNRHEVRWATVEKELIAIIYALRLFRPFIYGRRCTIVTDHQALVWIMNNKNPASRLFRWKLELSEYDFDIIHKPGIMNANADALSRIYYSPEEILGQKHTEDTPQPAPTANIRATTRSRLREKEESRVETDLPQADGMACSMQYDERTHITESDVVHFKHAPNAHTRYIYVVSDAYTYPCTYVQHTSIFSYEEGKTIPIDTHSLAVYCSSACNDMKLNDIWTNVKGYISTNWSELSNLFIFINQSDHNFFLKIKSILNNFFCNWDIQIQLVTNRIVILTLEEEKKEVLKSFHDNILGGHLGIQATFEKMKKQYFWTNMYKDIKAYVSNCVECKKNKFTTHTKMPMAITSTASKAFEKIVMDCVGPIQESRQGNRFMVTFQDELTKYAMCIATPNITAFSVAKIFIEDIILKHGIPSVLMSDKGTNFMSEMFQEVCKILKISHVTATVAHPQTVGQIERYHRTLSQYLRIYTDKNKDDWDEWIPFALFAFNTATHSSTKYTPHYLVYGFDVEIPDNLKSKAQPVYNYENYVSILKNKLKISHEIARKNLILRKENNKRHYDKTHGQPIEVKIGDLVLLIKETKNHKFDSIYEGPYEVLDVPSTENCLIKIKNKSKLIHKNKLKLFNSSSEEPHGAHIV